MLNDTYFAHSEKVFLADVCDNDGTIRHFCCDIIIDLISNSSGSSMRVLISQPSSVMPML